MMRKNLPAFTTSEKEKPEDYINIANRKINKKPLNLVRIEKKS